ncbi:mucin-17 isoform X1 [Anopheles funestus]|uniref:mucin-17 isoform X1 n=1 Tax=Anopheles funestus TaxID=62324 RepID=UPI0020C6BF47|nr:mucin-17 isoform X1 [Anopheles funestus]XP_049287169.1 mucin-17 isoform X1 [Anopheles funestus]
MSSQIPPLVCHTPPPIDFDADDDDDDYGSDIPEDDVIGIDDRNGTDCPEDDFGDFATVLPGATNLDPIPTEAVIDNETVELSSISEAIGTKGIFPARLGSDSPPSLILPPNEYNEAGVDETAGNEVGDEDEEDIDFQPFGSPSQPPEPPPEDSISLPSLHFDADVSKSEDDDNVPVQPNATSSTSSGSGIETEVDLPVAAAAERTTPVIQECGRFDDNTENDFTDFTTASNERSSVVLEIPTANDVSFELDDFAQLESTPSADSNFVSQQSRADFATFDADFSKFDSFQASFPATMDDVVPVKTPVEETKSMPIIEQTSVKKLHDLQPPDDEFDDFQEFATFSEQPIATVSTQFSEKADATNKVERKSESCISTVENGKRNIETPSTGRLSNAVNDTSDVEDDDDDFGEFSDFKQPETVSTPAVPPICTFSMDNVHKLLQAMFPSVVPELLSTDTGQQTTVVNNIPYNKLHSQLQDFDNTNALTYQHSKSSSSKTLVTALGIDSRNIMYGPKWNSSMPRFAANLSFNPLEPLKPITSSTAKETGPNTSEKNANIVPAAKATGTFSGGLDPLQANPAPNTSVPAAQFDWNSSGLVNPLEASHAHTLLLDLEQLEVMASLKDKINVDSSSYSPALRSTCNVANTVQLYSATTTATTITTTTPLLLPSSPSPTLPQPLPLLPTPTPPQPPTKLSSSLLLLPTTMNTTQMCNDNVQQTKNHCTKSPDTVGMDGGNNTALLMDCSTTLFVFANPNDDDCDLLISTDPIIPSTTVTMTTNNTATTPPDELVLIDAPCAFAVGLQSIVPSDRTQTFDDYLDLSVQEMLQKATTGQPEDGPKSEILDPQVAENSSPIVADDLAVKLSSFVANPAKASHPEEYEDIGSLDFSAGSNGSNNAQYSVAPQPVHHEQQLEEQLESATPSHHYVSSHQQQQPMSISSSPNSVPVVRTIKLPETHIFTPSRGVTPISRDITDRDIVVREYHDVEYSLERSAGSSISSKKESEFDEFNDFQSVSALPPALPDTAAAIHAIGSVRPVIGRSPTEELEKRRQELIGQTNSMAERIDNHDDDADDDDDEFSDFQTAVPSMSTVPPVNKPVSNVQNNRSNTSSPVMLLSPAILLPQQANTAMEKESPNARKNAPMGSINWPDPGIDPDELARFEAAFAKPSVSAPSVVGASNVARNQSIVSTPKASVEEDEWSDFISSKPATEMSIKSSPTSLPNAGAPYTGSEAETQEEWTDFISSTAGTVGGYTSHNRLSSSQNNFNYPRASPAVGGASGTKASSSSWSNQPQLPPPQFSSWNSNSLYYNPMSSLPLTNQQHPSQYVPQHHQQQQQQFYNRPEMTAMVFSGAANYSGSPKVPTNPQHHHAPMAGTGMSPMMLGQQPPMQLLPELSFITPNAGGHSAGTSGTKPATHSFLSNVISSSSFTKK